MQRIEPGRVTLTGEHYFMRNNKLADLHAKETKFLVPWMGTGQWLEHSGKSNGISEGHGVKNCPGDFTFSFFINALS